MTLDPAFVFSAGNMMALVGWATLALLPGWHGTQIVAGLALPAVFALAYAVLIIGALGATDGGFGSIEAVRDLFADDRALVAGWLHYLAFDLFVGVWQVREARRLGIPHLLVLPCLVLTFLLGPVGWLAFLVLRTLLTREVAPFAKVEA